MVGSTAADVWRIYTKPSLDGILIYRKRTAKQTSARLKARQEKLKDIREKAPQNLPSKKCHAELVAAKKCPVKKVYKPGEGYKEEPVCPIKVMIPCLRAEMKKI